jgi:hypothetical protein
MNNEIKNIWKVVGNLDKADLNAAATCHAIMALMIKNGVVTKEESVRQINTSMKTVIQTHHEIAQAMKFHESASKKFTALKTIQ